MRRAHIVWGGLTLCEEGSYLMLALVVLCSDPEFVLYNLPTTEMNAYRYASSSIPSSLYLSLYFAHPTLSPASISLLPDAIKSISHLHITYRVKPAVFDLFLAIGIGAYAVLWYFSILVSGRSHSHNQWVVWE